MSSRNIAIRKEIYDALRKEMRSGDSFTKVLARLLNQRGPLLELSGAWPRHPRGSLPGWRQFRGLPAPRRGRR